MNVPASARRAGDPASPVTRARLIAGLLAAFLAAPLGAAEPSVPALTIMPFQTATFVDDREAAAELDGFSEFSARLLYWDDTPREPILLAGRMLKASLLLYFDEWRGRRPPGSAAATGIVRTRVAEAYRNLAGPRLMRLVLDEETLLLPPERADALAGEAAEIPCVIENRLGGAVRVELSSSASAGPLFSATLQAGQSRGVFLALPSPVATEKDSLVVSIDGQVRTLPLAVQRHARGTLAVEVLDESGGPTPARIYLAGPDGRARAPAGSMHRIVTGEYGQPFAGEAYFHTGGRFTVEAPAGELTLEVVKGLEHRPERRSVSVAAGRATREIIRLERVARLPEEGWYSGDVHVHANLFAQTLTTPRDVLLAAEAEDLNVVNLLPCNDPRTATITDLQYFTGRPDAVSTARHILYFNEEMRNDLYGHVGFLNLKTFIEPAYFGWPHSPRPYDHPGNFPQAAEAKAQGAAVVYVHPGLPSEFPVDIALGLADTIDVMSQNSEDLSTEYWYRLLNCGFRCPVSAGTDAFLNIPMHLVPGAGRVYVRTGPEFNYQRWIDGFLAGRSFATNGPLLRFAVNGRGPGDELRSDGPLEVEVTGEAQSIVPMESLELIVNGRAVRSWAAAGDAHVIRFADRITLDRSSWVALRARGSGHRLVTNDREVYAHTSPVYFTLEGRPLGSRADAEYFIEQIDALIARMDQHGRFANPGQRDEIVARFRTAQEIYRRIATVDSLGP